MKGVMLIAILLVSKPLPAEAQEEEEISPPTSPLLVLLAAKDEASMAVEKQLVGELRLTLDTLEVDQVVIERENFLELTLPAQLALIQPLIRRFMARAVVWVTVGTNGGHIIQFVVTDRGNATIRTVEAGSPEELALAVRELLDTSYLFQSPKKNMNKETRNPLFSLGTLFGLNGGIYGYERSSLCGGVGIEGRFDIINRLFVGLLFAGKAGPIENEFDGTIAGWRIETGIFAGYHFKFGRFGIGPYGEAIAVRSSLSAVLGGRNDDNYSWWSFRGALGIEALLKLSPFFSIIVDWTVGGIAKSRKFTRKSDETSVVIATPMVDYSFLLGFVIGII